MIDQKYHRGWEGYKKAFRDINTDGLASVMEDIDVRLPGNCEAARGYIDGIIDYITNLEHKLRNWSPSDGPEKERIPR